MTPCLNPDVELAQLVALRLNTLLTSLGVTRLCLHGSRAKGTARPDSDYDFQMELAAPLSHNETWVLRESLVRLLGCPINLAVPGYTDPYFIEAIQPHCIEIWKR